VSNAQSLVIDSQAKTFASGCDVNAVSERFFALQGVTPDLIQALVTGRVSGAHCEAVQAYRQEGGRLLLIDAIARRAWDVDARIQAKATRSYTPQNEAIFVEIHKPVTASASMTVRKFVVNPDIPDSLFQISPPAGYDDQGC
jgi:histone H3/H4